MRFLLGVLLLCVLLCFLSFWPRGGGTKAGQPAASDLHIEIVPAKDAAGRLIIHHDKYFNVHLTNRTDKPLRIWDESCRPGHDTLNFRITDKNGRSWIMRKADIYVNWDDYPPKTISIAAGATYVWRVVPTEIQGTWSWTGMLEPNSGEAITIVPLFEIKPDTRTKKEGVWTGRVEGEAFKVRVVNPKLRTPHDYLWYQCPRQALKIMKADPKWINKRDPEYGCAPLHHASRFGFVEVVDWLLANGADVNATAYNSFTPLHMADDPRIVRLLLQRKPNLQLRDSASIQTPLESAASHAAQVGKDTPKWQEIVKLLLDAGAYYDIQSAIYLNDIVRVRAILKHSAALASDPNGAQSAPLRVAAREGRTEICKILLDHKADPNDWKHGVGYPILVAAIKHPEIVKLLLGAGADVKKRITWQGSKTGIWIIDNEATALHFAAKEGALESAKLLLDAGIDLSAKDTRGQTALDIARRCGQGEVAHLLGKRIGTAEAREEGWETLLRQLVFSAKWDRLKVVLQEKAVADIFAREGEAFMRSAAYNVRPAENKRQQRENAHHLAIIERLHALGIPIDTYAAIASNNVARVKELLKADPKCGEKKDTSGRPALQRAVTLDRKEIVKLLLDKGCDPNVRSSEKGVGFQNETALLQAAFWGRLECADMLIKNGANVNAKAERNVTPLHEAARMGNLKLAKLLLNHGADVNARDGEGKTPLDWVAYGEAVEMGQLLRAHRRKSGRPSHHDNSMAHVKRVPLLRVSHRR